MDKVDQSRTAPASEATEQRRHLPKRHRSDESANCCLYKRQGSDEDKAACSSPWSSFFWQYLAFFVSAHGVDGDGGGDGGDGGSNAGGDGGQGQSKTSVLALHEPGPRHSHRE